MPARQRAKRGWSIRRSRPRPWSKGAQRAPARRQGPQAEAAASAERKSQVRTVDRSERIRTYNYPENRISDHRVNYKANNLDAVMNGDLDDMIQALLDADKAARLASTN